LEKNDFLIHFLAGLGVGVAAGVFLAPEAGRNTRHRIGDAVSRVRDDLKTQVGDPRDAAGDLLQDAKSTWNDEQNKKDATIGDLREKAKETVDRAGDIVKNATEDVLNISKDVAHIMGQKLEEGGKRLRDA
jgi:gas vesicle protein